MSQAPSLRSGAVGRTVAVTGLIVLALTCLGPAGTSSAAPARGHHGKSHKPGGSLHHVKKPRASYWGAWIGDNLTGAKPPWDMSAVTLFEQLTGRGLSLVEFASPFYECGTSPCTPLRFPTAEMDSVRNYGAIPFLSWGSDSIPVPEVPSEPDFKLANVIAGNYDSYIREFAEAARDWGHPFFLRFNWEMNGDWFPWGQSVNGNQAADVVAAWRHVHDIFTSVGATNATWVWCPYADPFHRFGDLKKLYPGDEYVDWTSMDGFNWASNPTNPHPWESFDQIFSSTYKRIMQIAPKKPMVLAEIASTGSGKAKAAWINNMFKELSTKYRRIRGLIWFDQVDRGISWPLETTPRATRAFARGIQHWAFQSNGYATASTSPVQPPG